MSQRSPRFIPPASLVEITARTVGARYLLRPSIAFNTLALAIIGRALALQPVDLHAITIMSNHWHALVSIADALALSRFVQFIHSNVARTVNTFYSWEGRVFRKASFIVVGAGAEEARLRYILAQGTKEGLVRRPIDWPGVHSARALTAQERLVGIWRDREHQRRVLRGGGRGGGRVPSAREGETRYPIDLAPLPSWTTLDAGERILRVRRMLDEIERDARVVHPCPLGVAGVLAQDPLSRPVEPKYSKAPTIHTPDEEERIVFTMERHAFCQQLLLAKDALRQQRPAILPGSCFPPATPFRTTRAALWSAGRTNDSGSDSSTP